MKFENGKFLILNKEYSLESSCDICRDVDESISEIVEQHSEFKGTIKVIITYEE